ncbi:hypothetical protein [Streptomyces sp. AM6-12]|uniref:hypothetical protein n=1 Tax=Streptomyces sp. AM6-12 TaxID=3345149 RepID=UPI0037B537AE
MCAGNQELVERADLVIVAVRGQDRHEAPAGVRVGGDTAVVHVMAGVAHDELRRTLAIEVPRVRTLPLPAVRERRSVTVVHPSHLDACSRGWAVCSPVADESAFDVLSALTGP